MRYSEATQSDVITGLEPVHVEAGGHADATVRRRDLDSRHDQILLGGQFDVRLAARDDGDGQPGPFGDGCVVADCYTSSEAPWGAENDVPHPHGALAPVLACPRPTDAPRLPPCWRRQHARA